MNILKTSIATVTNIFLGKPCASGLPHRCPKGPIFSKNIYCMHADCIAFREEHKLVAITLGDKELKVPRKSVMEIRSHSQALQKIIQDTQALNKELTQNNNTAFEQGRQQGINMERQKLYNTLLMSRQLLLETLAPIGINEHRVRQFVEWYDNQRDSRVNPKQDVVTYKTCQNIIELEETLRATQDASVQLT